MWTWLKDATFWCIEHVYNICGDWGLAIIIITLIFRLLIYPITVRQMRSSYQMQKLQPKIKEIQEKYAGDQQRQQEEMQRIYAENKFNPLAGCLPMLLQMPIFIILYQTLREYIPDGASFYNLIPNLAMSLKEAWAGGIVEALPYLIIMILFVVSTFLPMLMQGNKDKNAMIMTVVMSLFMLWIGWSAPAGVMLYWAVSSFFGVFQQLIIRASMKRKDAKAEAESEVVVIEPVKVDVERKVKKKRPTKKH
jgi:YidC/Oxa1 family membrane protein insertase